MTIKDMIEKRAKVWETAKNFVDTHENENGVLSAEDNATYSRMEQEIEDLTACLLYTSRRRSIRLRSTLFRHIRWCCTRITCRRSVPMMTVSGEG